MSLLPNLKSVHRKSSSAFFAREIKRAGLEKGWKILGEGAYGVVFNKGNGTALKIMRSTTNSSEINALRKLNGAGGFFPRVIQVNRTNPNYTAFTMTKIPSGTVSLRDHLKKHPSDKTYKPLLRLAVHIMRSKGISHGDLHSINILVLEDGPRTKKLWVIDFGLHVPILPGKTEKESMKGSSIRNYVPNTFSIKQLGIKITNKPRKLFQPQNTSYENQKKRLNNIRQLFGPLNNVPNTKNATELRAYINKTLEKMRNNLNNAHKREVNNSKNMNHSLLFLHKRNLRRTQSNAYRNLNPKTLKEYEETIKNLKIARAP